MSSESTVAIMSDEPESTHYPDVIFPAGNSDFRVRRNRCARACREFNKTHDDADPHERSQKWLDIVRPDRDRSEDPVLAVTHDQTFANPALKAKTPFVKPPVYIDYGIRLHVGGSTFINRNCMIMDTPVADIVIGEGCNIGPNCSIVGVTHPMRLDERLQRHSIGQPVTIGDDVWIGTNVTILGGVTIGDGAVIGANSLVRHDVPPMSVAVGSPARVVRMLRDVKPVVLPGTPVAETYDEAVRLGNRLPHLRGYVLGQEQEEGEGNGEGVVGRDEDGDGVGDEGEQNGGGRGAGLVGDLDLALSGIGGGRAARCPLAARLEVERVARERELALAETLGLEGDDEDGEVQPLLQQARRQHRSRGGRRFNLTGAVVTAVIFALLMAFFFAGVYLGAAKA